MIKNLKIASLDDFKKPVLERYHQLNDVQEYLNEEGIGELEALKAIYYHSCFAKDLKDLLHMEEFLNLTKIEGKPTSYYKTINRIKVTLQRATE